MMATKTTYRPTSGVSDRALTSFLENITSNAATAAMVMTPETISSRENTHDVKNKPRAVGMVACIIMAPEILASASRSLPWRTQITAFMVSGSSVATGLNSSATSCGDNPAQMQIVSSCPTNTLEAIAMAM